MIPTTPLKKPWMKLFHVATLDTVYPDLFVFSCVYFCCDWLCFSVYYKIRVLVMTGFVWLIVKLLLPLAKMFQSQFLFSSNA
jgi:hypothetical protein